MIKVLVLIIALTISGCAAVTIHDIEICGDEGFQGATCDHTLTTATRDVQKAAWDAERVGMLCMKSSDFAGLKADAEQLCNDDENCTYSTAVQARMISAKLDALIARVAKANGQ